MTESDAFVQGEEEGKRGRGEGRGEAPLFDNVSIDVISVGTYFVN